MANNPSPGSSEGQDGASWLNLNRPRAVEAKKWKGYVDALEQKFLDAEAARDGAREALLLTAKAGNDAVRLRNQTMREAGQELIEALDRLSWDSAPYEVEKLRRALSESAEPA